MIFGCTKSNQAKESSGQRKQLFDFDWKFALGDQSDAAMVEFNDSGWRKIDLPHDWSIEGTPDISNPSGNDGGYFPTGIGWYRKAFNVPADWKNKDITVYFEGVYMNSEVFINGHSLGVYPYGYSSFYYDITPFLKIGNENVMAVKVDNSQQINCRWYSGSGIYRHVWLMVTNPIHFEQWGVAISTPEVTQKSATVMVRSTIKNDTDTPQIMTVKTVLTDKDGQSAGEETKEFDLKANENKVVEQSFEVDNPKLWAPENPSLYKANVQLIQNGKPTDTLTETFGIRSISYSAENGFQLNGKTIKLNGGCVHHDNGCLGAKAYDAAEIRRVKLLKESGFNAVRTSHNPPSEAFLDACDSIGLLVIDEAFDGWRTEKKPYDYAKYFDDWAKKDIQAMVLRDRNHPSIVMWSIGNEIIERKEPEAVETAKILSNSIKEIDTTRPVTSAMTTWDKEWEIFDPLMAAHDICGYNYQMHRAESDHQRVPSRIIVQTESYPRDAFYNWDMVQNHDYIIGDFVWTAMDYLGESGIGRYYYPGEPTKEHWEIDLFPWHGAYCGDIDLTGWRKPISHYRNILWNDTEKLYMAVREPNPDNGKIKETMWAVWPTWESWIWPGHEGKTILVEIYSKYPKVRLYLNNAVIGEQPTTIAEKFKATFAVPYQSGTLKAVGLEGNNEVESAIIKTASEPAKMKLSADRSTIKADGQDLSFVTVEITDEDGNIQPNADHLLQFEISGPGVIEGVGNANLKDLDSYVCHTRKAWKGKAIVVVKSTKDAGDIILKVSSSDLMSSEITIVSVNK